MRGTRRDSRARFLLGQCLAIRSDRTESRDRLARAGIRRRELARRSRPARTREFDIGEPIRTDIDIDSGAITFYFRKTIQLDADPAEIDATFFTMIDDGAIFYVNGNEVLRLRLPDGHRLTGSRPPPESRMHRSKVPLRSLANTSFAAKT